MSMNTIPEALDELRAGHVIIVVDDPDRENEGDLICAAEFATQANVNLMASVAKGLICMPMSSEIAHKLNLEQMVSENTDNMRRRSPLASTTCPPPRAFRPPSVPSPP